MLKSTFLTNSSRTQTLFLPVIALIVSLLSACAPGEPQLSKQKILDCEIVTQNLLRLEDKFPELLAPFFSNGLLTVSGIENGVDGWERNFWQFAGTNSRNQMRKAVVNLHPNLERYIDVEPLLVVDIGVDVEQEWFISALQGTSESFEGTNFTSSELESQLSRIFGLRIWDEDFNEKGPSGCELVANEVDELTAKERGTTVGLLADKRKMLRPWTIWDELKRDAEKAVIILRIIDQCQKGGYWIYKSQKCSTRDFVSIKKELPNLNECKKPFAVTATSAKVGDCGLIQVRVDRHKDFGSGGRSAGSFLGSWRDDGKELYSGVRYGDGFSDLPKFGEQLGVFGYQFNFSSTTYDASRLKLNESDFNEDRIMKLYVLVDSRTQIDFIKCSELQLASRSELCFDNDLKPVKLKNSVDALRFIVLGQG